VSCELVAGYRKVVESFGVVCVTDGRLILCHTCGWVLEAYDLSMQSERVEAHHL